MVNQRSVLKTILAVLVMVACCLPAQLSAAPPEKVDVLIGFAQPPGVKDHVNIVMQGGRINHSYSLVPAIAATVPKNALAGLMAQPNVLIVEPDGKVQAIDTDAELAAVWGVTRIGSGYSHQTQEITGFGVKVAVLDSGIDIDHPDLAANYKGGIDFVNGDGIPDDDNGHGTHCAGTIGAIAGNGGVVGVAPGVELYAVKVLDANGSGSFSDIIAGLQWCVDNQIHITSNSYGSDRDPGTIVETAFFNANAAGILNIAAAGNSGRFNGKGNTVGYPAAYSSVVAVAATDSSDQRAYFSSTGPAVELAAPGVQIYSTYLGGGYALASGTSMACPHAAGTAALLIQAAVVKQLPVDNTMVRQALIESADDLGDPGLDPKFGYGLVNTVVGIDLIQTGVLPPGGGGGGTPPASSGDMTVASIDYKTSGGKNGDKDLSITVRVIDIATQAGVPNATVNLTAFVNDADFGTASGTTDSTGQVTFKARNAPNGLWTSVINSVTASGYTWDGNYPTTPFPK
ncbi:MAG: S8 family peptidase [Planctomycetaceae bacterium]|nr:S8 family peptidase [Planctomycetaceae bacterium]